MSTYCRFSNPYAPEATAGESADVTEEPDADTADALFSVAVPDR